RPGRRCAVRPTSAADLLGARPRVRRRRLRDSGHDPGGACPCAQARHRSRNDALRDRRPGATRLPRRRFHGLELPRHPASRRRARGARRRSRAARCAAAAGTAGPSERRQLGRAGPRGRSDRTDRPRRRAYRRGPAPGRGGRGAGAPGPLRRARPANPSARPAKGAGMKTLRTVAELRAALSKERAPDRSIALVPTMGAFHEGHLSLMRRARADCDVVVVSLFVNPTQFLPGEDLSSYPRDEARDTALAAREGADLLFAPSMEEVYPDGPGTAVEVPAVANVLCGAPEHRGPAHFRGVATV